MWEFVEVKNITNSSSLSSPSNKTISTHSTERQTYLFSPCIPLRDHKTWSKYNHSECAGSNVCFIRTLDNGEVISAEGYGPKGTASSIFNLHTMSLYGGECQFMPKTEKIVSIAFSCDTKFGLGKPIKVLSTGCIANFNWPTIAACTTESLPDQSRPSLSKCYVYDDEGNERDLSPLIDYSSQFLGHEVIASSHSLAQFESLDMDIVKRDLTTSSSSGSSITSYGKLFISVCSELRNENCGNSGTMACYKHGKQLVHLADIRQSSIEYDSRSKEVVLKSSYNSRVPSCNSNMSTTIRFRCPHDAAGEIDSYNVLASRRPFVIANSPCEAIIEWETDYACPTHAIEGNYQSCKIKDASLGREIDLSPLSKNYTVLTNLTIDYGDSSSYPLLGDVKDELALRICRPFSPSDDVYSTHCGLADWNSFTVCHNSTASNGSTVSQVIGNIQDAKLRYADGVVTLIYPTRKGQCSSPHFGSDDYLNLQSQITPSTLITFPCNKSAGYGSPRFLDYQQCVYKIEWQTNLTCIQENTSYSYRFLTPCTVQNEDSLYDLSLLRKRSDQLTWQASITQSLIQKYPSFGRKFISLNVCAKINKLSKMEYKLNSTQIAENVAIVLHDPSTNSTLSLGRDISSPQWDKSSNGIKLTYVDNLTRQNGEKYMVKSVIKFHCSPGLLDSSPQLVDYKKGRNEEYEFSWTTAAACPLHDEVGTDCLVKIPTLDTVIDLNPLIQQDGFVDTFEDDNYKYYINVCSNLTTSPCINKNSNTSVGICQVEKGGSKRSWILGQANQNLTYWNGILTLNYRNGDKYNDPNKTPRSAQLQFVCSHEDTRAELISETNRTYFFRYYTKFACPDVVNMIPCLWTNGSKSIDLGRIAIANDQNHLAVSIDKGTTTGHMTSKVSFINICRPLNPLHPKEINCRHGSAACKIFFYGEGKVERMSLGIPLNPPVTIDDVPALVYNNGDPCPNKKSARMSSKLLFFCDPSAYEATVELVTTKENLMECYEVFHVYTNETCGFFPPQPQTKKGPTKVTPAPGNDVVTSSSNAAGSFPAPSVNLSSSVNGGQNDEYQPNAGFIFFTLFALAFISLSALAVMIHPSTR